MDLKKIKQMVQDSIDKGATSVEDVHRQIATMPIEQLQKLGVFEETLKKTKEFSDLTIGTIYDLIRQLNSKAGEYADEMLAKLDKDDAKGKEKAKPAAKSAPKA